jgi:hypothetical protein
MNLRLYIIITIMLMHPKSKNAFILFAASAALLGIGFFVFNNYIYQEKQAEPGNVERYQGQLTGEYVCLPHRDTTGPTTLECAFGIKTESGEHYAVDFGADNTRSGEFIMGQTVTLEGTVTPIEMLSTDYWQKYDVEGIISIMPDQRIMDPEDGPVVNCTLDAKECPDGSFVGRGGPNCEFAACP